MFSNKVYLDKLCFKTIHPFHVNRIATYLEAKKNTSYVKRRPAILIKHWHLVLVFNHSSSFTFVFTFN